jgi:homoserine kinase
VAADHLMELDADLLARASALEGHPDNAAAALLGGFVIVADGEAVRYEPPMGLEAVIVVPNDAVRTAAARSALPEQVPLADAIANVARGAMLTLGLSRGDWSLVGKGLEDRLHQPYRGHLFPASMALLERAHQLGALGATISGAGPSVMFWSHYEGTGALYEALRREAEGWAQVLRAPFEPQGAYVEAL